MLVPALAQDKGADNGADKGQDKEVIRLCNDYVDMLKDGKYDQARELWNLLDRTRAEELKINYQGCPLKLEIGSPLWQHLDDIRSGKAEYRVSLVTLSRDFAKVTYSIVSPSDTTWGTQYVLVGGVVEPQFVSSTHVFSDAWEQVETKYIRLHYRDAKIFDADVTDRADDFIHRMGDMLGVSNEKMVILETIKLNGFLCGSYGEVESMSGVQGLGAFVKSYDGVVGKYFPPYQELAQFMVAYANDTLPPVTLPIMQYGTATFLGGRWGRSARVLSALGAYLYQNDLVTLDTLITAADFATFNSNPDFAYPLAGLFCEFMFDKLGRDKYFTLYRQLSGTSAEVNAITAAAFKQTVATAAGGNWENLIKEFKAWLPQHSYAGIAAGADDTGELRYESGLKGVLVRVYEDSNAYDVVAKLDSSDIKVALVLRQRIGNDYQSFLFDDQFPDTLYNDYHYGILFSSAEAGTYDYITNRITGKYISGMTGDQAIYDPKSGEVRFRIEKYLVPSFSDYEPHLLLMK